MRLEDFKHSVTITPRFADVDMMGTVNNAVYHTYLEEARVQYTRDVFRGGGEFTPPGMILVKSQMDYLMPLHMSETIKIFTRCSRFGRKSFDLSYVMVMADDERLVSVATTTLVAYDYSRRKSVVIPESWRERVTTYETVQPQTE